MLELLIGEDRFRGHAGAGAYGGRDCSKAVEVPFVEGYVPPGMLDCRAAQSDGGYDTTPETDPPDSRSPADWLRELF